MGFIDHPQHVWWRKALFQIHLWVGIALCPYIAMIGITGSILVFESELEQAAYPHLWRSSSPASDPSISFSGAIESVRKGYPGYEVTVAYVPDHPGHNYEVFVHRGDEIRYVFVDAHTGGIAGAIDPRHSWVVWIIDLHFRLLAGKTGRLLNGIGAAFLLLLCLTGIVVWWAGVARWTRGLKVDLRRSWRRINFDLHSVIGFWALAFVTMWAFTGIYFVWPKPIESAVNCLSSVASARSPKFVVPRPAGSVRADLNAMIQEAQLASPHTKFAGAFFPNGKRSAVTLLMAHGGLRNFNRMDYVYFDPATGRQLALWHRGVNPTLGGKFIFWLSPLHFGYDWGLAIKILWALLGLALPALSVTGLVMYWNRFLARRWKSLFRPGASDRRARSAAG